MKTCLIPTIFFQLLFLITTYSLSTLALEPVSCHQIYPTIHLPALNIQRVVPAHMLSDFQTVYYYGGANDGLIMGYATEFKHIIVYQLLDQRISPLLDLDFTNMIKTSRSISDKLLGRNVLKLISIQNIEYINSFPKPKIKVTYQTQLDNQQATTNESIYDITTKTWDTKTIPASTSISSDLKHIQTMDLDSGNPITIQQERQRNLVVAISGQETIFKARLAYPYQIELIENQLQLVGIDRQNNKLVFFEPLF